MSTNRGRELPDATPPFLTKGLIDGWITAEMNALKLEIKDELHEFDKGQLHLIHKVEKLAGDGEQDIGAVGRLEKLVTDYISENRASSIKASGERQALTASVTGMLDRVAALEEAQERNRRVEAQVNRWKVIPGFTRNVWKIVAAILTALLVASSIWSKFHPQAVMLTPQQIQEIRKGP